MSRRDFVKSAGMAAAAGGVLPGLAGVDQLLAQAPATRVAVLWEPGLPSVDVPAPDRAVLRRALAGLDARFLDVDALAARLGAGEVDVLLLPYGSAFPKPLWEPFVAHLRRGGHLVSLGGVPAAVPVRREAGRWQAEVRQTAYHKRLGITQGYAVRAEGVRRWQPGEQLPWAEALLELRPRASVHELYVRLTRDKEFPEEDGSSGVREAVLTPLLSGIGEDGFPLVVPVLQLDQQQGEYTGGRWVLGTADAAYPAGVVRAMVAAAALGSRQLVVRPSFACYRAGETPELTVSLWRPRAGDGTRTTLSCRRRRAPPGGRRVAEGTVAVTGTGERAEGRFPLPAGTALAPGLYRVNAVLQDGPTHDATRAHTGFWVRDERLLGSGAPLTADAYSLRRGGRPFFATGTTYMASDVHRAFLLEPNPAVWDRDFAEMKRNGINLVRTGIWTGFPLHADEQGNPPEVVLRSWEAFVHTARRHDIPVVFTFFAFLPVAWGGENVYLDPRSLAAQKRFCTAFVRRTPASPDVVWDLINEPSFSSPEHLWRARPNYDRHEQAAWAAWLEERYPAPSAAERAARLQELWRTTPEEALELPRLDDFQDRDIFTAARPLRALEYRLFVQEMFARWARELGGALRAEGSVPQLVMVGQDEGSTYERPGNQFMADAVDATSIHPWWNNDDLVWNHVVTKAPGRANLSQEAGIMFAERIDGSPWRTEADSRDLLERKLTLSLGLGGAGFIEWIWNVNPYMPLDNEAAIGLLRVAGSAKPELAVVRDIARFAEQARPHLDGRQAEPALLVIPHSNLFSVRNQAIEATQRAVRTMAYACRTPVAAVSEYTLARVSEPPPLLLLPAPRVLRQDAWETLLGWVERGSTLVLSGPVDADEHWRPVPRLERLGVAARTRPVAQTERLWLGGQEHALAFRGNRMLRVETAVPAEGRPEVRVVPLGRGRIVWSPVPVELAQDPAPTAAFYRFALAQAGVEPPVQTDAGEDVLVHAAVYGGAVLYTLVSERGDATEVRLTHPGGASHRVPLQPGRAAMLLLRRGDGGVLARYGA